MPFHGFPARSECFNIIWTFFVFLIWIGLWPFGGKQRCISWFVVSSSLAGSLWPVSLVNARWRGPAHRVHVCLELCRGRLPLPFHWASQQRVTSHVNSHLFFLGFLEYWPCRVVHIPRRSACSLGGESVTGICDTLNASVSFLLLTSPSVSLSVKSGGIWANRLVTDNVYILTYKLPLVNY